MDLLCHSSRASSSYIQLEYFSVPFTVVDMIEIF